VAVADAVIIGKVTAIAAKPISLGIGAEFQLVTVKVVEALAGCKGLKEVKVGIWMRGYGKKTPAVTVVRDQEVLLFLRPNPDGKFFDVNPYEIIFGPRDRLLAADLDTARRAVKCLADPLAALKARAPADRLLAAATLLSRYRTQRDEESHSEPIPAEESKRILQTLAAAGWAQKQAHGIVPANLFFLLGLTEKDGWKQPGDLRATPAAAQKWLKDHAGTYRIQRYVPKQDK